MLPPPASRPRPQVLIGGYVDRVLRRVATMGDGWLTYFYSAQSFRSAWARIRDHAAEAGRDPDSLTNVAQLPICVSSSYEDADRRVRAFVAEYFDVAEWSESTPDSAIRGTPEQCAEQLAEHVAAGEEHIVLVPCDYALDQVERVAAEVLPALRPRRPWPRSRHDAAPPRQAAPRGASGASHPRRPTSWYPPRPPCGWSATATTWPSAARCTPARPWRCCSSCCARAAPASPSPARSPATRLSCSWSAAWPVGS